jgi:hypothetical protein
MVFMMVIPDCDECRALHGAQAIHKGESVLDAEVRMGRFESIEPGLSHVLAKASGRGKSLSANASSPGGIAGDMEGNSNTFGAEYEQASPR